jgi:hypothetical protein
MQEMNPLEKQLQSWMPRRPSAKIARRLFAKAAPAPAFLRRREVWGWLTPAAACVLTLLVMVNSTSRHLPRLSASDKTAFFATLMFNAAGSNLQQTFVLSKADENMEVNIWTHPFLTQTGLNVLSVIPTNR